MQINEIIRKYRKEKNMTQEDMANRLGVTAPAVNKWESGASTPDISLLAPIARLLHISLDELLSFNENLTDMEVSNIVNEIYGMFATQPVDTVYEKIVSIVREYPNAENLILSLATLYKGTGRYEEAYTILEDVMLTTYQTLSVIMHEIHTIAIKTENFKKAETLIRKEITLSDIFDMGEFNKLAVEIELTTAMQDADRTLALMDLLLSTTDSLMEYTKSDLFEHMTFNEQVTDDEKMQATADMVKSTQLKCFFEDDAYQFVRESAGWEAFKKKWCK